MNKESFVSIIIPCRNEERFIGKCLDSIIAQDYPKDKLEVLVVDGMSEDGTRETIKKFGVQSSEFGVQNSKLQIQLLENPKKITPCALNIGIKNAKGDIIIRMDAHAAYQNDYVSKCVKYLYEYNADNVGGVWKIIPRRDTIVGKSIAIASSSFFGGGNAYYRTGNFKEPKLVDTVPFGCYRREVFDRIGLFDEDLIRNQDDEFNLRLIKNGGKILLVSEIISYYFARESLSKLWKMHFQYGYFKPLVAQKVGGVLTWRQMIPLLFVGSLLSTGILSFINRYFLLSFLSIISLYIIANFYFSLLISIKNRNLLLLPFLMASFAVLHFSYGLGYLKGILEFIVLKKHLRNKIKDVPITR